MPCLSARHAKVSGASSALSRRRLKPICVVFVRGMSSFPKRRRRDRSRRSPRKRFLRLRRHELFALLGLAHDKEPPSFPYISNQGFSLFFLFTLCALSSVYISFGRRIIKYVLSSLYLPLSESNTDAFEKILRE